MSVSDALRRAVQRKGAVADIRVALPRRRRSLGLALIAVGVVALAAQGLSEWLLPYDPAALAGLRHVLHLGGLGAASLVWMWALACVAGLMALAFTGAASTPLALACGSMLGSAYAAAGGAAAALALLLLVCIASLGWHGRREGGLALLIATAATLAGWDALLSAYPTLWAVAVVLVLVFVWIDREHIRAGDRRLYAALAERDRLITRLDQRGEELGALQRARTQLLASISHDLRQPLQAVRLYTEALQARLDASEPGAPRWRELLRQQMRAADDAVAMLDQFSEFSAIEQGALQSHPENVELRDLLDGVAAQLQAAQPPARLRLRVHGRPHWVHTDRTQLARLVQNLAGNAVRYSQGARPGAPARVVLAVRPQRDAAAVEDLVIDVVDNGRGIPQDQLDAVYEPYVQVQDARVGASRGGRGLGLAIVRGLAAQLGLQLAPVRSRVGHGTRFRVRLPAALRRDGPGDALAPAAREDASRLDGWLLGLLEDEDAPRAAMRAALESVGATIVDADALDRLQARLDAEARFPDALVVDLDLGTGAPDGLAALDAMRAAWDLRVPAVIVTGRIAALGTVPLPDRCAVFGKPVGLSTLVSALRQLAGRTPGIAA